MKILITGASKKSFIGRHVFNYLGGLGYDVTELTRSEFENNDFSKLENVDTVIHCAWIREDLHSLKHMGFAVKTCEFFNECKRRGIRVINLGSSSEYGVKFEPMREDMICEPINTYGIAKLMVTLYAKKLGFNTLRLFTVIGEGGHSFFDSRGDKWEYPTSTRDCMVVKVVAKAVERLIHANHLYGEIINVGKGESVRYCNRSFLGLVDLDSEKSKWLKYPQSQYEPSMWVADITKMKKLLNI